VKRLLLAVLLLCASNAFAAGGGPTNPLYVREQQGTTLTFFEVSCPDNTTDGIALVTAAQAANARSILFQNTNATAGNYVTICPVAFATDVCDTPAEGLTLWGAGSLPIDRAIRDGAWSCISGTGAAITVEVLIEK